MNYINKRNIEQFFNYYGLPFNDKPYNQFILTILILSLFISDNITEFIKLLIANLLGIYIIVIIKNELKTSRPINCENTHLNYCPNSYDIPSGHSFIALFWLLVLMNKNIKYSKILEIYLLFIPLSRYLSKLHSLMAVIVGSILGVFWYLIYNLF